MSNPLKNRSEQMAEQWSSDQIGRQGDPDAPVGSEEWAAHVANEIHSRVKDAESDARQAERWIEGFKSEDGHKALGFESWDEFCKSWIGYEADQVETIISRRKQAQRKAGKYDGPEDAEDALPQHGEIGEGRERVDCNKLSSDQTGGTDPDYLAARIARDHPGVHERMKEGEFRSVRQAAIEAGIIKDIRTKQIRETDDPGRAAEKVREVYDPETINGLIEHLRTHAD